MILTKLKAYLMDRGKAPLIDMAHHFDVTPETMKGMLEHWIHKGKVRCLKGSACNKGCCQTEPDNLVIYEWI